MNENQSTKILYFAGIFIFLIIALITMVWILGNPTGGIAGANIILIVFGVLLGFINPKAGLFFLALQATYVDELKRIGVYFGATSTQTVQQILIGPLLTIIAINVGYLYRVIRGQFRFGKTGFFLYVVVIITTAGLFISDFDGGSAMLHIYNAATIALYMTLLPLCYGMFLSIEDWIKYISFQAIVAVPAAVWGIWQYFNGFSDLEWYYARTGLSPTHTNQMMTFIDPRVFGLFGSASAYGCVGALGIFTMWRAFTRDKHRFFFLMLTVIYLACVLFSRQRSIALLFPISFVMAMAFRMKITTIASYVAIVGIFLLSAFNSEWLINKGLVKANEKIQTEGRLGATLNVGTFSDRLVGWGRLTRAESWTLFGDLKTASETNFGAKNIRDDERSHDLINRILIKFGAVGILVCGFIAFSTVYTVHSNLLKIKDRKLLKDGAFILGMMMPNILLAFAGGGNFSTTPINLETWSMLSGALIVIGYARQQNSEFNSQNRVSQVGVKDKFGVDSVVVSG